ncbi:sodium/potassium/calcium exchanger 2-like isoform X2 [Alosa alosa]|uniref:sodium/potassium/calcium exchanger 2-like isoform X2 n=1 Tax=Alosa alosa TaxID=278164 RepID=UPI0020152896|nr:sodium/potassium/calcium exchanger 2-like isoform X2 [Alosa alosa]
MVLRPRTDMGQCEAHWDPRNTRSHRLHMRRKFRPSRIMGFVLVLVALCVLFSWSALKWTVVPAYQSWFFGSSSSSSSSSSSDASLLLETAPHRTLLSSDKHANATASPDDHPIAMRSSEEGGDYPTDLFSLEERRQGWVALHMFGMLYMFIALAIVCDEFFVPALTVITEKLEISDDVAGATFMAAGGSAPELFTSVIGVFVSHSNVGIGTIVGSAVFNILFVIGMCAIFSREILNLTWWPLFRDVSFYIIGLLMLIVFFLDNYITYYESIGLLSCYISYVTFMKFNASVEVKVKSLLGQNQVDELDSAPKLESDSLLSDAICNPSYGAQAPEPEPDEHKLSAKPRLQRGGSSASLHNTLMRHSIFQLMIHTLDPLSEGRFKEKVVQMRNIAKRKGEDEINGDKNLPNSSNVAVEVTPPMNGSAVGGEEEEEDEDKPLSLAWPDTNRKRLTYLLIFPIVFPLWLTLPDVRKDSAKPFFPITFLGSISWIAAFSYLMVWWAHQVGETFWITEEIMGLTILAAGTSIPDLITSVIVARKGLGDMAVSSSVGSNIFDITVGLPFPWLLYSFANNMAPVSVSSAGLFCAIVLLFLMLLFVIISIAACKWRMSKLLGMLMFLLYFVFLIVSVMLEDKVISCPVSI